MKIAKRARPSPEVLFLGGGIPLFSLFYSKVSQNERGALDQEQPSNKFLPVVQLFPKQIKPPHVLTTRTAAFMRIVFCIFDWPCGFRFRADFAGKRETDQVVNIADFLFSTWIDCQHQLLGRRVRMCLRPLHRHDTVHVGQQRMRPVGDRHHRWCIPSSGPLNTECFIFF